MLTVTIGPLARDVRDAALVAQAMAGPDGRDFVSVQAEPGDYLAGLAPGSLICAWRGPMTSATRACTRWQRARG